MFSIFHLPGPIKVLFSVVVGICLFPVVKSLGVQPIGDDILALMAIKEVAVGLIMGFVARGLFFSINIAGNLMATAMGLTSAQIFNPSVSSNESTVEFFYVLIGFLFFLAVNGHHVFISGLASSFEILSVYKIGINIAAFADMSHVMTSIFVAGIQIASPVIVVLFVVNIGMGIIGKAVPQLNVMVTGMAVNIMAGLGVMIIGLPLLVPELQNFFTGMLENFFGILKVL